MAENEIDVVSVKDQLVTELKASIRAELEIAIRGEFEEKFEIWKTKELAELEEQNDEKIRGLVKEYMDKVDAERKPLDADAIQKLLSQDYVTFPVKVQSRDGKVVKEFVIAELPQEIEEKFYKFFKTQLLTRASDVAAFAQKTLDLPFEKRMTAFFNTVDGGFDILSNATSLVLNPFGEDQDITPEWCKKNLTSVRQWNIVRAQIEVNKLRDFFSQLFESGTKIQTLTTPLNTQSLQDLLHR